MVLIIPIPAKDGLIREDFKEIQGRDQLKNHHNQIFGLYSDQCVVLGRYVVRGKVETNANIRFCEISKLLYKTKKMGWRDHLSATSVLPSLHWLVIKHLIKLFKT